MAERKFGELPPGQYFIWQGQQWQKTSPLLARLEGTEEPRMVPRSAKVSLPEGEAISTTGNSTPIHPQEALQQLQQESVRKIELLQLPADQLHAIQKILAQATENALKAMKISS